MLGLSSFDVYILVSNSNKENVKPDLNSDKDRQQNAVAIDSILFRDATEGNVDPIGDEVLKIGRKRLSVANRSKAIQFKQKK